MLILAPWFGDVEKFRPLADLWVKAYEASGCQAKFRFLADTMVAMPGWCFCYNHMPDLIRPGQPFDVKGSLVCSALMSLTEPLLVLDLDAMLRKDPTEALRPFANSPIAMPLDHGAITHDRRGLLEPPYSAVAKTCAGVMYFGAASPEIRYGLVREYRRAWAELLPILPWRPALPHLLEQYAWSLVSHRVGGEMLPHTFNWNPDHLGPSKSAVIEHRYGFWKWRG